MNKAYIIGVSIDSPDRIENVRLLVKHYLPIVEEGDKLYIVEMCAGGVPKLRYDNAKIEHVIFPGEGFNLSEARNLGIKKAIQDGRPIVSVIDADCIVPLSSIRSLQQKMVNEGAVWGYPYYNTLYGIPRLLLNLNLIERGTPELIKKKDDIMKTSHVVCVSMYYMMNYSKMTPPILFDETYSAWGPEDKDFFFRMKNAYGPPHRVMGNAYHINHAKPANSFYNEAKKKEMFKKFENTHKRPLFSKELNEAILVR